MGRAHWLWRVEDAALPYRSITGPLRDYLLEIRQAEPTTFIHLLLGQLALPHFWEQGLHRNTNLILDPVLRDMDRVIVTSVPYQIDQRDQYLARLQQELKEED